MEFYGTVVAQVFTSQAQIPVATATVAITEKGAGGKHKLCAIQVTNQSGRTQSIHLPTPSPAQSLSPEGMNPFSTYDLWVQAAGFEVQRIEDMQVFPYTETIQKIELIPLPEHTPLRTRGERYPVSPHDL